MSFSPAVGRPSTGSSRLSERELAISEYLDNRYAKFAVGAAMLLLAIAPQFFSGFWIVDYDYWPQTVFLILASGICGLLMVSGLHLKKLNTTDWLVTGFASWCLLSVATSTYKHDSILEFSRIAGIVAWYFALRTLVSRVPQKELSGKVLAVMAGGVTLVAAQVVWNYFQNRDPRQFGTFFNPNLLANALAMSLAPALGIILLARRSGKLPLVLLACAQLLLLLAALYYTSSKGGLLAGATSCLAFGIAIFRARTETATQQLKRFWPVLVVVLIFVAALGYKLVKSRITNTPNGDYSTLFRYYTWQGTARMALSHPLNGYGPATFPSVYPQFAETGFTRSAHQLWLQLAAESGFPALILLAASVLTTIGAAWKRLKEVDWPVSAAVIGTLTAFIVHGLTDAGWGITSIGILCFTALALGATTQKDDYSKADLRPGLQLSWLGLTLLALGGGFFTQRTAMAEDTHVQAETFLSKGASAMAVRSARDAIATDPLSARMQVGLASALVSEGNSEAAKAAYEKAVTLQPKRAANWLNLARINDRTADVRGAEASFDQAVSLDPNDTSIRLERAEWYLAHKDRRALEDLNFIIGQRKKPYGKFAATPEFVNGDYARATVILVPQLRATGKSGDARDLVDIALEEVRRSKANQALHQQMMKELGPASALKPEDDLDELERTLTNYQAFLAQPAATKKP